MFQNNLLMGAASISAGGFTVDESVRYNDDDSPRLYRTPASTGNRMTGSISLWYKRCNLGSIQQLFNAGAGDDITFNASDKLTFIDGSGVSYITTQLFRDPTAWGHLLFAWDTTLATAGDRLRIYHNGTEITAFDTETNPDLNDELEISNTVRQTVGANESDTEEFDGYLSQFYYVDGSQLTPTSFGEFDSNNVWRPIEFAADNTGVSGTNAVPIMTSNTLPSGTVSASASEYADKEFRAFNRVYSGANYWGNVAQGLPVSLQYQFDSAETIALYSVFPNATYSRYPTGWTFEGSNNGSDWTTLDTVTGATTGGVNTFYRVDTPASYTYYKWVFTASTSALGVEVYGGGMFGTQTGYGNNGFFLDFADSSDFGNDVSGNNNDYTSSGLAAADQVTDTPTLNYPTWNSVAPGSLGNDCVYANGNLEASGGSSQGSVLATMGVASGKWYWEFSPASSQWQIPGMVSDTVVAGGDMTAINYGGGFDEFSSGPAYGYYADGNKFDATSETSYGDTFTTGDIVGVAFDADNGIIWFSKNGTYQNSATIAEVEAGTTTNAAFSSLDTSLTWFPFCLNFDTAAFSVNFGQQAFSETVPTGFKAINTANLPAPQRIGHVDSQFVGAYDTGANIVATLNAARDETWTNYINMYRMLSGSTGANWQFSDDTSNQLTLPGPSPGAKSSFINPSVTGSSATWTGYSWRVGSDYGVYTAEISHTNGADTDQAHGLTSDSSRFLAHSKRSDAADEWWWVHPDQTSGNNVNFYWAAQVATEYVTVDSTNVTVKSTNATGTYRVIVWAEMSGWRKFSGFTGNGNNDGPFLWMGGTPKFYIGKRSTGGEDYHSNLRARDPNGTHMIHQVALDWYGVENTTMSVDGLAGAVKLRSYYPQMNGAAMITWAECTPFGGDGVSPATVV